MIKLITGAGFIAFTIAAFAFGRLAQSRIRHPLANATLIAILLIIAALLSTRTSYASYMQGGGVISWLLGPATVALGIPLALHAKPIKRDATAILLAVFAGAAVSAILGPAILMAGGGSHLLALSIAPKAVTTPIAMGIAERTGGVPALAAVLAIIGGVIVAAIVDPLLTALKIHDHRVFGLAAGVAGSGIGTAQAVLRHPQAGAYAALAIGLNAIITAILLPILYLLHWL